MGKLYKNYLETQKHDKNMIKKVKKYYKKAGQAVEKKTD